jgi:S-(hydroxymethyl)glutathione dehydrogenase/alcohol dehydrogenase
MPTVPLSSAVESGGVRVKTKGALLWGVGQEWSVEEIELGDPRPGEVMVELAASGLCHSDEHLVRGDWTHDYPILGGHEGAGVVTKVGDGVTKVREGDHVVLSFIPSCSQCEECRTGRYNMCDNGQYLLTTHSIADGTARVQARGQDVVQMCLLGTFSPYVTVHADSVVKIDESVPLHVAALVGCGVTTGWGSATKVGQVAPGDTVVVVGVGGIGVNAVQGAAAAGAKRVIAVDPVEFKRSSARHFGATHTFATMEEALAPVIEMTWGKLADKVILSVGDMEGDMILAAQMLLKKGGRLVVTGLGPDTLVDVKLNLFLMTNYQHEVKGALFGGASPQYDIPLLLSMYQAGKLQLDDLITKTYTLEEVGQGYQDMKDGKNLRGVILYSDADRR